MEYLKLLIADDEENIRNGLKCIIDWDSLGFKFCGEASNGKDAVSQIIELSPDVVILDIKMPGMTGIEVIKEVQNYCRENNKISPQFIILSGYSDFEYAQKTLNMGAKGYLLKPVDEDELQEKVLSIKNEILERIKVNNVTKKSLEYDLVALCQDLLKKSTVQITPELEKTKFMEDSYSSNYQCILLNLDGFTDSEISDLSMMIDTSFSFFTYVKFIQGNNYIILIKTNKPEAVTNCAERLIKIKNDHTFICLGDNLMGLEGLYNSYKNALELRQYLFYYSNQVYLDSSILKDKDGTTSSNEDFITKLIFCIETYDKIQLEKLNQTIKEYFQKNCRNETDTKKQMIYILVELNKKLTGKYPERNLTEGKTLDIVQKIMDFSSFDSSFDFFESEIYKYLENFNFNTSDSTIIKLIAYIKSNYASELKLESLGDMFNCNSAYLGKKFKKFTGVQFNTYLDNIRIEQAKEKLRNTELKIYQISKLVGYSNTDYFFMKFKKNTGITPKEFKSQIEKEKAMASKVDDEKI